eukprot:m.161925 g.161925  ORF g.161925 m.161925 type:complete len:710 (+) comp31259_c2_seq1:48-2177(+)
MLSKMRHGCEVQRFVAAATRNSFATTQRGLHNSPHLANRIEKLVVANRGEIAVRIMDTARKMGVRTVAVYSDADAKSQHVLMADEAYNIGPAESSNSYLRMDKILEVARKTGANGVHPGYGFLSENAAFATALEDAGIEFVGPPASAITSMGIKSLSKKIMIEANVPCVPGYHGPNQDNDYLMEQAKNIGFPVMIKAVLGGGGKGMRIALTEKDFFTQLEDARKEADNSFNDTDMLLERYVERSRHVEVQVFADKLGNAVYLFERDCSVQRRHQKIIEEAPAPSISAELRKELGEAAVRAAKAVGYVGAGTVEFIMDTSDNKFYFMEMNTRLQVEHPVTEMITGTDLVEWQLKVAAGERVPLLQEELQHRGHSFEARIYAEDPANDFRPGSGPLLYMNAPTTSEHVRVDSGVVQGDNVSVFYDPMIAKLVVWGEDRDTALSKLISSLRDFHIAGLATNIDFVAHVASHPKFKSGDVSTAFIDENRETLMEPTPTSFHAVAKAGLSLALQEHQAVMKSQQSSADPHSPWGSLKGMQSNGAPSDRVYNLVIGEEEFALKLSHIKDDKYIVTCNDETTEITGTLDGTSMRSQIGGVSYVDTAFITGESVDIFSQEGRLHATFAAPAFASAINTVSSDVLLAPMDGAVQEVLVKVGDVVAVDDPVMIMYSMKMQMTLRSPRAGIVETITPIGQVKINQALLTLAEEDVEVMEN